MYNGPAITVRLQREEGREREVGREDERREGRKEGGKKGGREEKGRVKREESRRSNLAIYM